MEWSEKILLKSNKTRRLFHQVLDALPVDTQTAIYNRVGIVTDDPGLGINQMEKSGGYVTFFKGVCFLWLRSPWLAKLTTKDARYVIAHELAHVYHGHEGSTPEIEQAADNLAAEWGFIRANNKQEATP